MAQEYNYLSPQGSGTAAPPQAYGYRNGQTPEYYQDSQYQVLHYPQSATRFYAQSICQM